LALYQGAPKKQQQKVRAIKMFLPVKLFGNTFGKEINAVVMVELFINLLWILGLGNAF